MNFNDLKQKNLNKGLNNQGNSFSYIKFVFDYNIIDLDNNPERLLNKNEGNENDNN